jgi:glycosyltransferase involved in cell wall biosynthesis
MHLGSSEAGSLWAPDERTPTSERHGPEEVSVVVPTRDRPDLVLQAVRSVLAQRGVDLEVLVVDDGSRDPVEALIGRLGDQRVKVLRHASPEGVASARNVGVEAASGSWIALLDDDDLWAPTKLVRQLRASEESGASWVYAGAVEVDVHGELLGGEPPASPELLLRELRRRNLMPAGCSNVVVRADAFRAAGGFDPALRHLADWDLWLKLARAGPPACVREPLVAYRIHPEQATMDVAGMLTEGRVLRDRHGVDLNGVRRWLAWSHLRHGRRRRAVAAYARSALAGDVASLGRAAVAAIHPAPTSVRTRARRSLDVDWVEAARSWVGMAAAAAP